MRVFFISFTIGGMAGYILSKMNVNTYLTLGIVFCIGIAIGLVEKQWQPK